MAFERSVDPADLTAVWLERGAYAQPSPESGVPAAVFPFNETRRQTVNVIIGVDLQKATHTAVALDGNELELSEIQVPVPTLRT